MDSVHKIIRFVGLRFSGVFTIKCNLTYWYFFRGFPLIKTRDVSKELQVCSYHITNM